jgi:NAD(P)-dependent dehydrogenase (short-subunit alcohol dehydrogenase family)
VGRPAPTWRPAGSSRRRCICRIINISGGNARNLSGGARDAGLVHMTKTLAVQLGRHGITVNCIHPGTTRTEAHAEPAHHPRHPAGRIAGRGGAAGLCSGFAARQYHLPRGVDASEIAFVAVFLAPEKAWAVSGELLSASGRAGRSVCY